MQRSLRQCKKAKQPRALADALGAVERQPLPMLVMMPMPNEAYMAKTSSV
jgi:hypothetical protein